MKALMVEPRAAASLQVEDIAEPKPDQGSVLIRAAALGVCGTDREIIAGRYGSAPPGHKRLVLGHESLGIVESAPPRAGVAAGDLVVGFVRTPDPLPCACCAAGEWDRCTNGGFTEHGVKALDGFGRELYRLEPDRLIVLPASLGLHGVLVEPASVVAKAWEDVERIGRRDCWNPGRVLVTGAGPVGLLAALLGVQRHFEVHVLDRATSGPKPRLVRDLGATYHSGDVHALPDNFDIVIECTGAASLLVAMPGRTAPDAVICLLGISGTGKEISVDAAAINNRMVLGNRVIVGSVNANRRHYEAARDALVAADAAWLGRLIARRVPFDNWQDAFEVRSDDVKTIVTFAAAASLAHADAPRA
jgi:threonine dehydrogenase-like Zn-dependent dehydrogenase